MASFKEDVKSNLKENFRSSMEDNTGIVGQVLRERREKEEKNQQTEREVGAVEQITQAIRVTGSTLTQIELLFTQISKNFQAINTSFGVVVTTQDETNDILKQQAAVESKQSVAGTKSLAGAPVIQAPDEAVDPPGGPDLLGPLFDVLVNVAERIAQRIEKAAARRAARKAAEQAARKAAEQAAKKAAEKATKKAAAEAAKKGLEGKAKQKFIKAAEDAAKKKVLQQAEKQIAEIAAKQAVRAAAAAAKQAAVEVIKKSAIKAVAKNLGKAVVKSIPFVGVAVGLGFAAWKLVQGDPVGAGIEAVGGLGSAVTAIPAAIASTIRDVYFETYGEYPESDPLANTRLPELKQIVSDAAAAFLGKKAEPVPPATAVKTPPPAATTAAPAKPATSPVAVPAAVPPTAVAGAAVAATSPVKPPKPASGGEEIVLQTLKAENLEPKAIAAIMAQVSHESGGFKTLEENLNYGASSLKSLFSKYFQDVDPKDYERQPEKIANRIYGNRMANGPEASGDGWKYRGRGFIQLTGKQNYTDAGKALGVDLINNPDLAADPKVAAQIVVWFFKKNMKRITDWSNVEQITRVVNGGLIGLEHRKKEFESFLAKMSGGTMVAGMPTSGVQVAQQSAQVASEKTDMKRNQQPDINIVKINDTNTKKVAV